MIGLGALSLTSAVLDNASPMRINAVNPLPDSLKGDVIASTKLLGPGEQEILTFTAPKDPGSYEYVCTFPGHFAMMRGVMKVK